MKIIYFFKSNKYSGAENVILTIMSLISNEYEVIYVSPKGPIESLVKRRGLKYIPLNSINPFQIRKIIKEENPDIIHANDFTMSSIVSFLAGNIPVISHLHNNPSWIKNPFNPKSIFYALSLPFISKVITVSDSIQKEYVYNFLLKKKNIILENVVDLTHIRQKAMIGTVENSDLIFLGRLTKQKNPLFFCRIVKKLKKTDQNIKAVMIGRGELREEIIKFIRENNLSNNIKLLGFKTNPYPYINNSKIGVMPSIYEGFGLAAVEMLCLGKPVLCNKVGGLQNIVTNDCGLICFSLEDYIMEINKLLKEKDYYNFKSMEAFRRANLYGNIKEYKNKILSIYNSLK